MENNGEKSTYLAGTIMQTEPINTSYNQTNITNSSFKLQVERMMSPEQEREKLLREQLLLGGSTSGNIK